MLAHMHGAWRSLARLARLGSFVSLPLLLFARSDGHMAAVLGTSYRSLSLSLSLSQPHLLEFTLTYVALSFFLYIMSQCVAF